MSLGPGSGEEGPALGELASHQKEWLGTQVVFNSHQTLYCFPLLRTKLKILPLAKI